MTTGFTGGTNTLTRQDNISIKEQGNAPVLVMGDQQYQLPTNSTDLKWFRDQFEQVVQKLDQRIGQGSHS